MSTPQIVLLLLALADVALGGLISNGFIVTVILREWTRNRSLASSKQLLLSLVLSNFWATVLLTPLYINSYITHTFTSMRRSQLIFPFADLLVLCRFWLTAWLCVFYCIKIVNSTHSLFLWCKLRISWLLPRLIAGSLVVSLIVVLLTFYFVLSKVESNTTMNDTKMCQQVLPNRTVGISELLVLTVGSGCPLLVVLVCSFLVVASLCRHICLMKAKDLHSASFQRKAHVKAAGTVLSLLFLYLSFYLAQTLSITVSLGKIEGIIDTLVVIVYPSAQAYILLLVNPKLKQAIIQVLPRRET